MAEEEKVRQRFEASMRDRGWKGSMQFVRNQEGVYLGRDIESHWHTWQAAYALGREDGIEQAIQREQDCG